MRLFSLFLATLAITQAVAQDSFCTKYAKAVFNTANPTGAQEYALISAIVGRVVVGCNDNTAQQYGISGVNGTIFATYAKSACSPNVNNVTAVRGLVSDPLNAPFFAGFAPNYNSVTSLQALNDAAGIPLNNSIRFVNVSGFTVTANPATTGNNSTGAEGLAQHLVSFFGSAFGCPSYNANTNTEATNPTFIGKYNGIGNMKAVHANMKIGKAVWEEFIGSFSMTLQSFNVSLADIKGMVVPVVAPFLLAPAGATDNKQICNQPDCTCIPGYNNDGAGNCVASSTGGAGGTTSPPTGTGKNGATMVSTSVATIVACAATLLAYL